MKEQHHIYINYKQTLAQKTDGQYKKNENIKTLDFKSCGFYCLSLELDMTSWSAMASASAIAASSAAVSISNC